MGPRNSNLLADVEGFYYSLRQDGVISPALELGFSARALLMLMLQRSVTRALRWQRACSTPIFADKSMPVGSRYLNNVAKIVGYAVLARITGKDLRMPKPAPRARFDGMSIRAREPRGRHRRHDQRGLSIT